VPINSWFLETEEGSTAFHGASTITIKSPVPQLVDPSSVSINQTANEIWPADDWRKQQLKNAPYCLTCSHLGALNLTPCLFSLSLWWPGLTGCTETSTAGANWTERDYRLLMPMCNYLADRLIHEHSSWKWNILERYNRKRNEVCLLG